MSLDGRIEAFQDIVWKECWDVNEHFDTYLLYINKNNHYEKRINE